MREGLLRLQAQLSETSGLATALHQGLQMLQRQARPEVGSAADITMRSAREQMGAPSLQGSTSGLQEQAWAALVSKLEQLVCAVTPLHTCECLS